MSINKVEREIFQKGNWVNYLIFLFEKHSILWIWIIKNVPGFLEANVWLVSTLFYSTRQRAREKRALTFWRWWLLLRLLFNHTYFRLHHIQKGSRLTISHDGFSWEKTEPYHHHDDGKEKRTRIKNGTLGLKKVRFQWHCSRQWWW